MGTEMSDRKNLKINEGTHEKLSQAKRDNETWDGFFERLLDDHRNELEETLRTVFREELERFAEEREE